MATSCRKVAQWHNGDDYYGFVEGHSKWLNASETTAEDALRQK